MNLIAKASGGHNIIARPMALEDYYAPGEVLPAAVEVYWHFEDEPAAAAKLIGRYAPGASVTFPYTPIGDKNVVLRTVSISASGVRSVRDLRDAPFKIINFQRITTAPTVAQVGAATHTLITLAIDGYPPSLATKRRVRVADNSAMTTGLQVYETSVNPGELLPRLVDLMRTDGGTGTRTVYVRVAHSSGGDYGAESGPDSFTYANSGGTGGGSGSEDPFPRREYEIA
jgi:hypothetical protein